MHIRTIPLHHLRPAPYNPRVALQPGTPAYERLARSLQEFDLVQPIVWNERTGHVVAGHQRIEVLKHQGAAEVECVVVDLPLEREQALNVTLNNAQVGSDWDPEKLVALLHELLDLPDFDETLTGFDPDDLNDLLLTPDEHREADPAPLADEDDHDCVRVTLEIPPEDWDAVRPEIDELIARLDLVAHVAQPAETGSRNKVRG